MKRVAIFTYGIICYAITMSSFAYLAGFVGNVVVPKSLDAAVQVPIATALLVNLGLLTLFGIQHSVMARPSFKRVWTKIVPEAAERSTYCLFSSAAIALLVWQWQPMGGVIWEVQNGAGRVLLHSVYAFGWALLVFVTFLINHFHLFGLRQVYNYLRGREEKPLRFVTPLFYKFVRHPLYIGWFLIFWATPTMTAAHLVLAVSTTVYILIAIYFEERNLVEAHGESYENYRREVPMLIPGTKRQRNLQEALS
ncbi:isoprenylcysteine carboxylmethyltransferase family protein [bacterium]|nr:isoprenylcysteine carboxylmethyltransferase family protein [bacterium]